MKTPPCSQDAMANLLQVACDLRDPHGGCPWDREQTHKSLAPCLLEEVYELLEILEQGPAEHQREAFREELGDLLFQVVIHAQLAAEKNWFTFSDVVEGIVQKLVRRHPHVYGETIAANSQKVLENWERIKAAERTQKDGHSSVLDGVPAMLPALQRAARLGQKAARVGFDWQTSEDVLQKIGEELSELKNAADPTTREEELGDLLFAIAQYARKLGIDPEQALRVACNKFEQRFRHAEKEVRQSIAAGQNPSAEEWEKLWQKAKLAVNPQGDRASR
ncbi:MAG: nucleoside triphosphate pyrophosphohydrolase [Turneriella sp.]|nr:nucleoside triphosphate pyrophosphohydrolase [Turneriella sp.]